MTHHMLQTSALTAASFIMLGLMFLYVRALAARIQFLEDENRWLRAEVEHLNGTKADDVDSVSIAEAGRLRRAECERGSHVITSVDAHCTYCGESIPVTVAPPDFPMAVALGEKRYGTIGVPRGKR